MIGENKMTTQELIETYEKAKILTTSDYMLFFLCVMLIVAVVAFLRKETIQDILLVSVLISFAFTLFITITVGLINNGRMDKWTEVVETKYIEHLPVKKDKIIDYAVTSDYLLEENDKFFTKEKSSNSKHTKISIVKIIYLSDGIKKEKKVNAKIVRVKDLKEPYIEYQYLENNLPYDVDVSPETIFSKGFYNTTLYLPK